MSNKRAPKITKSQTHRFFFSGGLLRIMCMPPPFTITLQELNMVDYSGMFKNWPSHSLEKFSRFHILRTLFKPFAVFTCLYYFSKHFGSPFRWFVFLNCNSAYCKQYNIKLAHIFYGHLCYVLTGTNVKWWCVPKEQKLRILNFYDYVRCLTNISQGW